MWLADKHIIPITNDHHTASHTHRRLRGPDGFYLIEAFGHRLNMPDMPATIVEQ
jgi:hypothetical protein